MGTDEPSRVLLKKCAPKRHRWRQPIKLIPVISLYEGSISVAQASRTMGTDEPSRVLLKKCAPKRHRWRQPIKFMPVISLYEGSNSVDFWDMQLWEFASNGEWSEKWLIGPESPLLLYIWHKLPPKHRPYRHARWSVLVLTLVLSPYVGPYSF